MEKNENITVDVIATQICIVTSKRGTMDQISTEQAHMSKMLVNKISMLFYLIVEVA